MKMKFGRVRRRMRAVGAARDKLYAAIKAEMPPGTYVSWHHGDYRRSGTVQDTFWGRVRVLSPSGKYYWIEVSRILAEGE